MPGILPMKVIKVGSTAQSRIAQACDRCRSKKIRCDGFRPCCSQCANVGFECKTSDKLSRRAFPRGYTESLEERVRALETEVRELKDLLDGKDEKIDMLSKVHSHSPQGPISPRTTTPSSSLSRAHSELAQTSKEDVFKIQQSPFLLDGPSVDGHVVGTSSGRALIDSFKLKLQQSGRSNATITSDTFFPLDESIIKNPTEDMNFEDLWKPPPRMVTDQMVNVFFQEWAPLFPVIHRPAFLTLYEEYMSDPDSVTDMKSLAQLHLVFGIAALSTESRIQYPSEDCERQWVAALNSFMMETSLVNVQCLILAQIYCMQKGDFDMLLHYKGLAVSIAQRLGLHFSQKRFALDALTSETRKKTFWSLYAVDCFSSASLGAPKLMRDEDIHCEYPVDADDEYISENGFQPSLPGEFTKISGGIALFKGTRILSKVLEQIYPTTLSHEVSLAGLSALDRELEAWSNGLPTHLRLSFEQDKPSTNVITSRCPLLSLTYNYIKCLIHRPAACANLGEKSSSSLVALSAASKRIIQIVQLLHERNLSFSHCLNKNEILTLSGFSLLYQILDLEKNGKLLQDCQRTVCSVVEMLDRLKAHGFADFRKVACSLLSVGRNSSKPSRSPSQRPGSSASSSANETPILAQQQLHAVAALYATNSGKPDKNKSIKESRRATAPASASTTHTHSPSAENPTRSTAPPSIPHDGQSAASVDGAVSPLATGISRLDDHRSSSSASATTNLDYFQFPDDPAPQPTAQDNTFHDTRFWDKLINNLGDSNFSEDAEWTDMNALLTPAVTLSSNAKTAESTTMSPGVWNLGGDFVDVSQPTAQSVLSFSDESLHSSDEFGGVDLSNSGHQDSTLGILAHYTPESYTPDDARSIDQQPYQKQGGTA